MCMKYRSKRLIVRVNGCTQLENCVIEELYVIALS